MSRRRSRVLASVGVLAAAAGVMALPSTAAQAAAQHVNGHIAWPGGTAGWSESDADGSNAHAVTPTGGGYTGAGVVSQVEYSPDGTKVAFVLVLRATPTDSTARAELWIADASGANAHRVVAFAHLQNLAWSPDAAKIYFVGDTTQQYDSQVNVVNVDGSGLSVLPGQTNCVSASPTVAPNGTVAFSEECAGATLPVAVALDPGATSLHRLGFRPESSLAYSPDGKWIAYISTFGPSGTGLNIIPAAGGAPIQISAANVFGSITWSPDGASLLTWTSKPNGSSPQINVLNKVAVKPGSPLVPIATGSDITAEASWQNGASTAPARPVADRIGGADRVDTSVKASQWSFDTTGTGGRQAASAVITRSDLFADALAGNALAAEKDGPLFMTGTTALDPRIGAELTRILPRGANVYILGGTKALSTEIDTQVGALGFTPVRVAGDGKAYADDRYGTAQAIADQITGYSWKAGVQVPVSAPHSVFVATGLDYPDALAAGAAAAQDPNGTGVVMLSDGTGLLPWTQAYLAKLDPAKTHVYTVGGQATTAVAKAFPQWRGLTTPLAGADRYQTAYQVATHSMFGPTLHEVGIATAANWPDALSGGALIGLQHGPLLLAGPNGLTAQEASVLGTPGLGGIAVFGGTSVVSGAVLNATADTAFGAGGWNAGLNRQAPALK